MFVRVPMDFFCNQYHLSYDQVKLIIQESRLKNWPMPTPPEE